MGFLQLYSQLNERLIHSIFTDLQSDISFKFMLNEYLCRIYACLFPPRTPAPLLLKLFKTLDNLLISFLFFLKVLVQSLHTYAWLILFLVSVYYTQTRLKSCFFRLSRFWRFHQLRRIQTSNEESVNDSSETSLLSSTTGDLLSDVDSNDLEPKIYTDTESIDNFLLGNHRLIKVNQRKIMANETDNYSGHAEIHAGTDKMSKAEFIGKIKMNLSMIYDEKKCEIVSMKKDNRLELIINQEKKMLEETDNITNSKGELKTSLIDKKEYFIYNINSNDSECLVEEDLENV